MMHGQMETAIDPAHKFGAGRYVQASGAILRLGAEVRRIGGRAYVLAGGTSYAVAGAKACQSLEEENIPYQVEIYVDACCQEKGEAAAQAVREGKYDVVIGIGGGRILDMAKLTARLAGCPVITVPTSSATCAAFAPLSVVYTPEGKTRGTWYFPGEVSAVLADMDIIANQPPRLLAAGIIDAMAKWLEVRHYLPALRQSDQEDVAMAAVIAEHVFTRLSGQALAAYRDCVVGTASRAVHNVVYASIVGAGIVSGTARGQYQSALAHALYEWVRTECLEESAEWLHGEIVGVGLFVQAAYNGDDALADALRGLMRAIQMPTTFAQMHISMTPERLQSLYQALAIDRFILPDAQSDRARLWEALHASLSL